MKSFIYILKIAIIAFLMICTFGYLFKYPDSFLGVIAYSFFCSLLVILVSLFLLGRPSKKHPKN